MGRLVRQAAHEESTNFRGKIFFVCQVESVGVKGFHRNPIDISDEMVYCGKQMVALCVVERAVGYQRFRRSSSRDQLAYTLLKCVYETSGGSRFWYVKGQEDLQGQLRTHWRQARTGQRPEVWAFGSQAGYRRIPIPCGIVPVGTVYVSKS